jgi:site-specific DNA-methyltransferase (adenine-specific)
MNIETTNAQNTTETAIGFIPCYRLPFLSLFHADCMEIMKQYPDKYFDLAIVDPPYGIGEDGRKGVRTSPSRPNSYLREPKYKAKGWDNKPPDKAYFNELLRVSKNVIIWGANHFIENIPTPNSSCWIVWDKKNEGTDFADCELAWTNMKTAVRKYTIHKFEGTRGGKDCIHPTQKPVNLYDWILTKYATEGMKILDTHFGSGSIALAVDKANRLDKMNLHLTACEIDKEYIDKAIKRISESIKQGTLSF